MGQDMPWSVDDTSYKIRDEFFTSPFGHPAYVILDGTLEIKHKFIGPCCGYESYYDCTPDIARTLETTLSGYLDTILLSDADPREDAEDDVAVAVAVDGVVPPTTPDDDEEEEEEETELLNCNWSEWSPCSIRCGPTQGTQIRFVDRRCNTQVGFDFPIFESRECAADNAFNCNVEDGGSICIPEFGEREWPDSRSRYLSILVNL